MAVVRRAPPRAVLIFDLDGTLVDSRADIARAANHARVAIGLAPLPIEQITGFIGDGARRLIERSSEGADAATQARALTAFHQHYGEICCDATVPYPGVLTLLERLVAAGWPLAVATNKPLRFTTPILVHTGLAPLIRAVRGGDQVRKPDPGQLLELCTELGGDPAASWMIGDHHTDIRAARAAGCRMCWCTWGFGERDDLAVDVVAEQPAAVLTQLALLE